MTFTDFIMLLLTIVVIILTLVVRNTVKRVDDIIAIPGKNVDWHKQQLTINKSLSNLCSILDKRIDVLNQRIDVLNQKIEGEKNETYSNDIS